MATGQRKDAVVRLRLSSVEADALKASSEAHGITMSEALRRHARAVGGIGPTLDGDERALVRQLSEEMRRCGVNLNQIAHAVNRGLVPSAGHAERVLSELRAAIDATRAAYLGLCSRVADQADQVLAGEGAGDA